MFAQLFLCIRQRDQLAAIGLREQAKAGVCGLAETATYPKQRRDDKVFMESLRASLVPHSEDFAPLPTPDEYDWLYDRATKGQTFASFVQNHGHRRPKVGRRRPTACARPRCGPGR